MTTVAQLFLELVGNSAPKVSAISEHCCQFGVGPCAVRTLEFVAGGPMGQVRAPPCARGVRVDASYLSPAYRIV